MMMMTEEFDKEKLQRGKFICHGSFGDVYKGEYGGQKVVIKALENGKPEEAAYKKMASVWSKLNHLNVARFIGAAEMKFKDEEKVYWCMVSEFYEGGYLSSYLAKQKKLLPLKTVLRLALDIARGLSYMHSEKIIHRNVRVTNMLLDSRNTVKLTGFGQSRKEAPGMTGNVGTKPYMAPEVERCEPYDHKCDVYNFGIILWEIFYCRCAGETTPWIGNDCPLKLADLMRRCRYHCDVRPEMSEVVKVLEEMSAEEEAKPPKNKGCFSFFTK